MKTYTLTLGQAVGAELANEVRNEIGTEHADELEIVEPAYEWVRPGEQCTDILNAIKASLNIDSE